MPAGNYVLWCRNVRGCQLRRAPQVSRAAWRRAGRNVHLNVLLLANRSLEQLEAICRTVDLTHAQYVALFVLCLTPDTRR